MALLLWFAVRGLLLARVASAVLEPALVPQSTGVRPPVRTAVGTLAVRLRGLPSDAIVTLDIAGPASYSRRLTGSGVVNDLRAGSYTVTASVATADGFSYNPVPAMQVVKVADGVPGEAAIAYLVSTGKLHIALLSLPDSARPSITVTGPGGFSRQVEDNGVTLSGIIPGSYTILAPEVVRGDTVYSGIPARQQRTVMAGGTLMVEVSYGGGPPPVTPPRHIAFAPGYHDRTMLVRGVALKYKLFIPARYDPVIPYPVVLYMHGSGEAGNDNVAQTRVGLGAYLASHGGDFSAVAILPQTPAAGTLPGGVAAINEMYLAALDSTMNQVNADSNRIYITGVSAGGFRVWGLAYRHPERFAAIAPVSGGVSAADVGGSTYAESARNTAEKLRDMPIWMWHGETDAVVPFATYASPLREAFAALGSPLTFHFVVGQGRGHELEVNYFDPAFWAWLFAQHR